MFVSPPLFPYRTFVTQPPSFTSIRDFALPGDYRPLLVKPKDVEWTFLRYDIATEQLVQTDLEKLLASEAGRADVASELRHDTADGITSNDTQESVTTTAATTTGTTTETTDSPKEGRFLALTVAFSLGSSQYATMCLREIMKIPTSSAYQKTLNKE